MVSASSAGEQRKHFVCGYKNVIEYMNSLITVERKLVLNALHSLKRGNSIEPSTQIELVKTLMRYRLLPIDENKPASCRFFSYLCVAGENIVHEADIQKTLYGFAIHYLQEQPAGPRACYRHIGKKETKQPLFSLECLEEIEKRIRPIPIPLAISQSGLESSWGKSRFSEKGNNFFGIQTVFSSSKKAKSHLKCVPAKGNSKRCLYKFQSAEDSFFIYSQILNSARAYASLRNHRWNSEKAGGTPCEKAIKMVQGLKHYAEDPNYLKKIGNTVKRVCQIMEDC